MSGHDRHAVATTVAIACAVLVVSTIIGREAGWNPPPAKYVFVPLVLAVAASMASDELPAEPIATRDALVATHVLRVDQLAKPTNAPAAAQVPRAAKRTKRTRFLNPTGTARSQDKAGTVSFSVLSYNVCWECMAGVDGGGTAAKYGRACRHGQCAANLVEIATYVPHMFIGLQEADEGLATRIANRMAQKYGMDCQYLTTKGKTARGLLLYNGSDASVYRDNAGMPIVVEGLVNNDRSRPFVAAVFKVFSSDGSRYTPIIVSSVHGPHTRHKYIDEHLRRMMDMLAKCTVHTDMANKNPYALPAIVMGDFNQAIVSTRVTSSQCHGAVAACGTAHDQVKPVSCPVFTPLVTKPTCCIPNPKNMAATHTGQYDNILVAPGACDALRPVPGHPDLGTELTDAQMRATSDHLPVAAALTLDV